MIKYKHIDVFYLNWSEVKCGRGDCKPGFSPVTQSGAVGLLLVLVQNLLKWHTICNVPGFRAPTPPGLQLVCQCAQSFVVFGVLVITSLEQIFY